MKEIVFIVLLLLCAFSYLSFVTPLQAKNSELEQKLLESKAVTEECQTTIDSLKRKYERLRNNDDREIETVLREKYGYCREGETMVIFN